MVVYRNIVDLGPDLVVVKIVVHLPPSIRCGQLDHEQVVAGPGPRDWLDWNGFRRQKLVVPDSDSISGLDKGLKSFDLREA